MAKNLTQMSTTRLEAFSDGVIAVIITIMVLELHVPREDGFAGLWSVAPRLSVYFLSFLMVGIYWINHHDLIRRASAVDYGILWSNLGFLFVLSLIPYAVQYLDEKKFDSFATVFYQVIMLFGALAFFILRWCVMWRQWYAGSLRDTDRSELWKHGLSLGLYLMAIPVACYRPWLSLSINFFVTIVWVIPSIGTRNIEAAMMRSRRRPARARENGRAVWARLWRQGALELRREEFTERYSLAEAAKYLRSAGGARVCVLFFEDLLTNDDIAFLKWVYTRPCSEPNWSQTPALDDRFPWRCLQAAAFAF